MEGVLDGLTGDVGHFNGSAPAGLNSHTGGLEEAVVQTGDLQALLLGIVLAGLVPDDKVREPNELLGEGEEHDRSRHIEDRVHDSYAQITDGLAKNADVQHFLEYHDYGEQHDRADDLYKDMDPSHTLGVLIYTEGGQKSCYAGTDIAAHDDRERHSVGEGSGP